MRIEVQSRSGKVLISGGVNVDDKASVQDLQHAISKAGKSSRMHHTRQRLTVPGGVGAKPTVLSAGKQLSEFGLADGSVVTLKDLGPQIGYSTLFFWEYFGPLVLYALVYLQPALFYPHMQHAHKSLTERILPYQGAYPEKDIVQKLALVYWTFHFSKRILETFLVHKFSHATVPVRNLFKNCVYYWSFGVFVAYFINHPLYTPPPLAQSYVAFGIAVACQLANLRCHVIQSSLRPGGGKGYAIPRGFLFEYVTCANYCAEVYGWIAFTVATQTVAPGIFILCGTAQMIPWAAGKHARLRKIFNGKDGAEKYPRRWVMLPPFY